MRVLCVFLVAIVAMIVGAAASSDAAPKYPYCCSVDQWSALVTNWDPQRNFFAFGFTAYDLTNNREAFSAIEAINNRFYNVTYLMLYGKSTGYRIIENFEGARCQKFQINRNLPPFCIPNAAVFRGNMTVGGSLVSNVFEWMGNEAKGYIHVSADGCVPIRADAIVIRNPNVDEEEYFDYVPLVDPTVFTVPNYC